MTPFVTVTGKAAPLMLANIDTDVIIRIERLTGVKRRELGSYAFESLRYDAQGNENPDFVLNRPAFRGACILVTGRNFACGSSREGAVWSLMQLGIRCVIAESFGDIFYNNCFMNGLLPAVLPADVVARLSSQLSDGGSMTVDLQQQRIVSPDGERIAFDIDDFRRRSLLEGLDEIGSIQQYARQIQAWQARDRCERPWIWGRGATPG